LQFQHVTTLHHSCTYSRLPEDGPSCSKHVEHIKSYISLENVNFIVYIIRPVDYAVRSVTMRELHKVKVRKRKVTSGISEPKKDENGLFKATRA
jgi:hypothetical protein